LKAFFISSGSRGRDEAEEVRLDEKGK